MSIVWVKAADNFFDAVRNKNKTKMRIWLESLVEGPFPSEHLEESALLVYDNWNTDGLNDAGTKDAISRLHLHLVKYKRKMRVHLHNQQLKRILELELPIMEARVRDRGNTNGLSLAKVAEAALNDKRTFGMEEALMYRKLAHRLWDLLNMSLKGEKIKKKHLIAVKKLRKRLDALEPRLP